MRRSPKASFEMVPNCGMESFKVREFKLPAFASPWHFHPEYELTYIVNGTGSRFVGDSIAPFGPGDLVLIGGDLPHVWRSQAPAKDHAHSVVVHFNKDSFGAGFSTARSFSRCAGFWCGLSAELNSARAPRRRSRTCCWK